MNILKNIKVKSAVILTIVCLIATISCANKEPDIQIIRKQTFPENLPERLELDAIHREVHDSTKWGQGEAKPWEERYRVNTENDPYQGGVDAE